MKKNSIFVGTPKAGIVSEPVKNFINLFDLMIRFSKEAMAY